MEALGGVFARTAGETTLAASVNYSAILRRAITHLA
jgi:hypothetical protein